jgi:hypothetical protein
MLRPTARPKTDPGKSHRSLQKGLIPAPRMLWDRGKFVTLGLFEVAIFTTNP